MKKRHIPGKWQKEARSSGRAEESLMQRSVSGKGTGLVKRRGNSPLRGKKMKTIAKKQPARGIMLLNPVLGIAAASVPPGQSMTNNTGAVILRETTLNAMRRKYTHFREKGPRGKYPLLNQLLMRRSPAGSHTIIMKAPNDFEHISHMSDGRFPTDKETRRERLRHGDALVLPPEPPSAHQASDMGGEHLVDVGTGSREPESLRGALPEILLRKRH